MVLNELHGQPRGIPEKDGLEIFVSNVLSYSLTIMESDILLAIVSDQFVDLSDVMIPASSYLKFIQCAIRDTLVCGARA